MNMKQMLLAGSLVICIMQPVYSQIKIESGGLLACTGNLQNAGTISNDGKIQVQGNFINPGTYNSTTADDSLIFFGAGNSDLNGGSAVLNYLQINKSSAGDIVKLTGTTQVGKKMIFDQGTFTTDPINFSFVLSLPVSAQFSFAAGKEIIGRVRRTGWLNGSSYVFNQPNMQVITTGGTGPSDFTVNMIPQSEGGDPSQNEREVKRRFFFTKTGGTGYITEIRFPYLDGELNTNTESGLAPWELITNEWNKPAGTIARDNIANYVSLSSISIADLSNEWKLADARYSFTLTAFLRGSWNGTNMSTQLNSNGVLTTAALAQPYNTAPFNYTGTESVVPGFFAAHTNIVDWVLVEYRKPASGLPADALTATNIGRKAGFLLNNGSIVDLDGTTPILVEIVKQGGGFITVRHRNHLGIMSNFMATNTTGTFANNFSVLANTYKNPSITSNPVILLSGSTYGLWAGDATKNGLIDAPDLTAIKQAIADGATGYQQADVNLSANTAVGDVNLYKVMATLGGQGSTPARPFIIKSHIPGN